MTGGMTRLDGFVENAIASDLCVALPRDRSFTTPLDCLRSADAFPQTV